LGEAASVLQEDADGHGLDVDITESVEVRHHCLEHRSLVGRTGREVLVDGHGRRALVRLLVAAELAATLRTVPHRGHAGKAYDPRKCRPRPGGTCRPRSVSE